MLFVTTFKISAQTDTISFAYSKPLFDFDKYKPVLITQDGVDSGQIQTYLALTPYREGVNPTVGQAGFTFDTTYDPKTGINRLFIYNRSLEEMLSLGFLNAKRQYFLWEIKDPSKYRYNVSDGDKTAWLRKNGFCFEYLYPDGAVSGYWMDELRANIGYMLGLQVTYELRKVKSLVLVRNSTVDKIKTSGGERTGDMNKLINEPIYRIGEYLDNSGSTLPFKDEAGYKEMIDLNLNGVTWSDVTSVRKALQAYDLDLVEREAEVKMWVVSEIKKSGVN